MSNKTSKQRPGIVIYFDQYHNLDRFSNEDRGLLLGAMIAYAEYGEYPDLPDTLMIVWPFLQQKLDMDQDRYDASCRRSAYANYCKAAKECGTSPISFEKWKNINEGSCAEPTKPQLEPEPKPQTKQKLNPQTKQNIQPNKKTIYSQKGRGSVGESVESYGEHHMVKLSVEDYNALVKVFSITEVNDAIRYLDSYAYDTGNDRGWINWNQVIRQCITHDWIKNGIPEDKTHEQRLTEFMQGL